MKKCLVMTIAMVLAVFLVAGCSGVKTYTDVNQTISVTVNEEFIIALDANPTTGYNWQESHDDSRLSRVGEEYRPDEKASGLVGAGGTQYYRFKALKAGVTTITLTYKRAWETGFIAQKVFTVEIR